MLLPASPQCSMCALGQLCRCSLASPLLQVQSCLLALVCHDIVVPRAMLSPRARKRATATKRAPTDESVKVIGVLYEVRDTGVPNPGNVAYAGCTNVSSKYVCPMGVQFNPRAALRRLRVPRFLHRMHTRFGAEVCYAALRFFPLFVFVCLFARSAVLRSVPKIDCRSFWKTWQGHFIARELLLYGHRTREQVLEEASRLVESIEKGARRFC